MSKRDVLECGPYSEITSHHSTRDELFTATFGGVWICGVVGNLVTQARGLPPIKDLNVRAQWLVSDDHIMLLKRSFQMMDDTMHFIAFCKRTSRWSARANLRAPK